MLWLILFSPLILVILLAVFLNWRAKRRNMKFNLDHTPEQYVSNQNQINNAAARVNAMRNNHDGGGGGF
ncbi:hypothetical protein [Bacillus sp. NEB1478]|uniref:hypothetical protein n=1 Tax=Bacillus sp. NEB1478 TaxID=3073816 RepID=UPI002872AEA0|nr:hypothetical protein [Bacillus sp. NEB1478]WNB91790.1 hypothetical protein RGB74_18230 [Bacillus sp. NEB1478]